MLWQSDYKTLTALCKATTRCKARLAERLGIEAEEHTVYQMTRYRLKAKLSVARPQNCQQDSKQREALAPTSLAILVC